jgi:hypothetical protein
MPFFSGLFVGEAQAREPIAGRRPGAAAGMQQGIEHRVEAHETGPVGIDQRGQLTPAA